MFKCVLTNDRKTMTMVICTDYKGEDKATTGIFLDLLYKKYIPSNDVVQEEIILSDRPTPEFKVIIFFEVFNPF